MKRKMIRRIWGTPQTRALPNPAGGARLETFVPWKLVDRRLKKQIITPYGGRQDLPLETTDSQPATPPPEPISALLRALGLAHYWQRLLDDRQMASVSDIAAAEGMNATQVRRIMRLALLAPMLVERLANPPADFMLESFTRARWLKDWEEQLDTFLPPD